MCQTIQWVYNCAHPATYRFRNAVCSTPGSQQCQLEDYSEMLPTDCRKCSKHNRGWTCSETFQVASLLPVPEETWFVPTRCFVDVGFSTLNPFATSKNNSNEGSDSINGTAASAQQQAMTELETPCPITPLSACGQFGCQRRASSSTSTQSTGASFCNSRKASPCCMRERQCGAYQSTRLEGFENRHNGRIVDSRCESAL